MKFSKIITFSIITLLFGFNSCTEDLDDLRVNPNKPTEVSPSLLFTGIIPTPVLPFYEDYAHTQYSDQIGGVASQLSYVGYRGTFKYGTLTDIASMNKEAEKIGNNIYPVLGKFIQAHTYFEMARRMGDIPLEEALKLDEDKVFPKYDSQKSVFVKCLSWLDEANNELSEILLANPGASVDGDLYYNGDLKLWQKAINSYTLRVLIELSKKEVDAELQIKSKFANIINNPNKYPIFESIADDMQFEHKDEDGFRPYLQPDNVAVVDRTVLTKLFIDLLKERKDPRLFTIADPTPAAAASDPDAASKFESYNGFDIAGDWSVLESEKSDGLYSKPNNARYVNFVGIPSMFLGYVEQEFTIAEAAHRGWVDNAQMHFNNAIKASMKFNGVSDAEISTYMNGDGAYLGDTPEGLTQILNQKFVGFFQNSGNESFFNQRRTGVPAYTVSEFNTPRKKIPVRWMYPTSERDGDNSKNLKDALIKQFGDEIDDVDYPLWHMK